jgi:hypothetical protein
MIVSEEIKREIIEVALQTGKTEEDVLKESIKIYKEFLNLQKEFKMWDEVSDIDFLNFEKKLEDV